jgi:hypothetical protein
VGSMQLYKFISLQPFERVADALLGRRLYCPKAEQLNDPLEGMLGYHVDGAEAGKPLDDQLSSVLLSMSETDRDLARARVCCFSAHPDSMQMWSYYAGGHKGLCLEVDVSDFESRIVKVEYVDDTAPLRAKKPVERLAFKHSTWRHEQEYRLITIDEAEREFMPIKINSVLISASTDPAFLLPLFELCRHLLLAREIATFSTLGEFTRFPLRSDVPFHERLRTRSASDDP